MSGMRNSANIHVMKKTQKLPEMAQLFFTHSIAIARWQSLGRWSRSSSHDNAPRRIWGKDYITCRSRVPGQRRHGRARLAPRSPQWPQWGRDAGGVLYSAKCLHYILIAHIACARRRLFWARKFGCVDRVRVEMRNCEHDLVCRVDVRSCTHNLKPCGERVVLHTASGNAEVRTLLCERQPTKEGYRFERSPFPPGKLHP